MEFRLLALYTVFRFAKNNCKSFSFLLVSPFRKQLLPTSSNNRHLTIVEPHKTITPPRRVLRVGSLQIHVITTVEALL